MRRLIVLIFGLILALGPARAADLSVPAGLRLASGEMGRVLSVSDGDTLTLSSGQVIRLVGIQAPKLPLGRPGFETWPLADEAREVLVGLVAGKGLIPAYGGAETDRHGRRLAHLFRTTDGLWVQKAMLEAGYARVYSFADNRAAVEGLLAAETRARDAKRGIWAHPYYAVRSAGDLEDRPGPAGRLHLVEGRVASVAHFRDQSYVNFGKDYRSDFTVLIERSDRRNFGADEDLARAFIESLKGKSVRVRGWLFFRNGPMIKLTHKEQIEFLPERPTTSNE